MWSVGEFSERLEERITSQYELMEKLSWLGAAKAGARAVLQLLIEEHERYLSTNEPRSGIGPMFDAGLNTAAGEMLKSCRERLEELSR